MSARPFSAALCVLGLGASGGCSFILDFSDSAIPKDAEIDGPFTQDLCDYKEPNDTIDTAALISTSDVGPAATCPKDDAGTDDHDFYRFTVPAGTASVQVKITFPNRGDNGDLDLRLFDVTGTTMYAQSRGILQEETITCPATSPPCPLLDPGDYVFEVFPAAGSSNDYTMALTLTPMI
ncbi:MAG: PPC domain-containing protein [Proteobacteria bacterium]|nr:PPC domain-containing protein [Pseudomonadota bacterium]